MRFFGVRRIYFRLCIKAARSDSKLDVISSVDLDKLRLFRKCSRVRPGD